MNRLNPSELNVIYSPPATEYKPVDGRKYRFAKANNHGEAYLCNGYDYENLPTKHKFREELRAEWIPQMGQYVFCGKTTVNHDHGEDHHVKLRLLMSQQEIPDALAAIMYSDRAFFFHYPWLLDSPIYIQFQSKYEDYNKMIYYGTPRQYLNETVEPIKT